MTPSIQEHILKIIEVIEETPWVRLLRVEFPKGSNLMYLPGQFFMVSLVDDSEVKIARAYSVATSPLNSKFIEIGFDKVGIFTAKLFELKVGDTLRFKGPYGKFFFDDSFQGDIVLIGAGTGLTPLMSIIQHCALKKLPNSLMLLYSARTPEAIIYRKELLQHKKQNHHFDYTVTITRPEESAEEWSGKKGRIDEALLREYITNPSGSMVFICGPKEFVFGLISMLEKIGIAKEQIKTDVWG